jgi:hypothetical protein
LARTCEFRNKLKWQQRKRKKQQRRKELNLFSHLTKIPPLGGVFVSASRRVADEAMSKQLKKAEICGKMASLCHF